MTRRINRRYKCDCCGQFCAAYLTDRTRTLGIREHGIFLCMRCLLTELRLFNDGQHIKTIIEGDCTAEREYIKAPPHSALASEGNRAPKRGPAT